MYILSEVAMDPNDLCRQSRLSRAIGSDQYNESARLMGVGGPIGSHRSACSRTFEYVFNNLLRAVADVNSSR